jgi:hypothetical protein
MGAEITPRVDFFDDSAGSVLARNVHYKGQT